MPPRESPRCKLAQSLFLLSLLLTKNFSRQFIARSATRPNRHPGECHYRHADLVRISTCPMNDWYKSAVYKQALETLLIPIFVSTEQAMEWGSHLNAKQHATLIQTQCALSDAARSECHPERKLRLAMQSQLMREAGQAFCASVIPLGVGGSQSSRLASASAGCVMV